MRIYDRQLGLEIAPSLWLRLVALRWWRWLKRYAFGRRDFLAALLFETYEHLASGETQSRLSAVGINFRNCRPGSLPLFSMPPAPRDTRLVKILVPDMCVDFQLESLTVDGREQLAGPVPLGFIRTSDLTSARVLVRVGEILTVQLIAPPRRWRLHG